MEAKEKAEKPEITVNMKPPASTPSFTESEVVREMQRQSFEQNKIKQPSASAPTYKPKNFYEQFAIHDGHLYVNINNSWIKIANFSDI